MKNRSKRAIFVLGCEPHTKTKSESQARVLEALKNPAGPVIFSGIDTATAMARMALELKIFCEKAGREWPWEEIILENLSHNTNESIRFSFLLFRQKKLDEIMIITSWYHLPRTLFLVLTRGRKIFKCRYRFNVVPVFTKNALRNCLLELIKLPLEVLDVIGFPTIHRWFTRFKERYL